jgi:hypothetical protein
MNGGIRKSVIAGSWYPGDPRSLRADIRDYFQRVPEEDIPGEIVGLIAPHAGYVYSGQVAAFAYKHLIGKSFDAVVVIGPSHRALFHGVSIYPRGGYETPLGIVHVDERLAEAMMNASPIIADIPSGHVQEHSVEIQLPFLQAALGEFLFVPLVMGNQNRQTCSALADAIVEATGDRRCLIVGSSDLSHFHSHQKAVTLDTRVLRRLEDMDNEGLLSDLEQAAAEACGGGPMAVTMSVAKKLGAHQAKVMPYANSGDRTGDRDSVVGYASALFFRRP